MSELLNQVATALEGRYEIKEELGSGGMATVFLAHDLQYEREVAVNHHNPAYRRLWERSVSCGKFRSPQT